MEVLASHVVLKKEAKVEVLLSLCVYYRTIWMFTTNNGRIIWWFLLSYDIILLEKSGDYLMMWILVELLGG